MSFLQFAAERGLLIDSLVCGRWVRVPTTDHPRKRNGSYWFGLEFGHVQNWATMNQTDSWQQDRPRTPYEQADLSRRMEESRKAYAAERAEGQRKAAQKAACLLGQCELDRHGYLEKKGFADMQGNILKREGQDPTLVIPMHFDGALCGCQLISSIGEKKFLFGQRTNDATFTIGSVGRTFIVEGYASALSLHAILKAAKVQATICTAFSVGNAARVARRFPDAFWIADNDRSGAGQKAAAESGCKWWMPPEVGQDINDFHREVGTFRASQILKGHVFAASKQGGAL